MNFIHWLNNYLGLFASEGTDRKPDFVDGLKVGGVTLDPPGMAALLALTLPRVLKQYSDDGTGDTVSDTADETAFTNQYSIPADSLEVGDRFNVLATVAVTGKNASETLDITLRLGGTDIAATGAVDCSAGDVCTFDIDLTVTAIGASGSVGVSGINTDLAAEASLADSRSNKNIGSLDTTGALVIDVTADWSAANAANVAALTSLSVVKYPAV